jgi:hypothetical protein
MGFCNNNDNNYNYNNYNNNKIPQIYCNEWAFAALRAGGVQQP